MLEPITLVTDKSRAIADAKDVLAEASQQDFEAVVVVGVKDGTAMIRKSRCLDTLRLLGAIELAKHTILDHWESKNG